MKYRSMEKIRQKRKKTEDVRHSQQDALTEGELKELINATDEVIDQLYIVASGYQGMRVGEIAHMDYTWIDFQSRTITIPARKECSCYECMKNKSGYWTPKTKMGARKMPIRKPALEIFRKYFTTYRRVNKTRQTIYKHIKDIAKRTTITKEIYPHSLRATAGTLWANMGVPANILKQLMGWENIETANKYLGTDKEVAVREAIFWEERYAEREDVS